MLKRLAAALGGLALALGGAVVAAPAAQATPQNCFYYVYSHVPAAPYEVVEAACYAGATGSPDSLRDCYNLMRSVYIPAQVAYDACLRAAIEQ
jgi:hypothetical protein